MLLLLALVSSAFAAESFAGQTFYVGDIHVHTGASRDGGSADLGSCSSSCGAAAELGAIAVANGLDFFALTEHTNGGYTATPSNFATVWEIALAAHDPDAGLVVIPGAELHFKNPAGQDLGHKTLLLFGRDEELAEFVVGDGQPAGSDEMEMACEDIWSYMSDIESRFGPALLLPHHPALEKPMATDYDCDDADWSPVVEMYSRHGSSLSCSDDYDPPWSECDDDGTLMSALDPLGFGLRVGLAGGTDSHDTDPGGVCAPEDIDTNLPYGGGLTIAVLSEGTSLDRSSLYDAFTTRRVYASTGPALPVHVSFSADGATLGGMGQELQLPEDQPLDVALSVPEAHASAVVTVSLLGPDGAIATLTDDGRGQWSGSVAAGAVPAWVMADVVVDGAVWYAEHGCDDGGADDVEHVWLSPTWIELVAAESTEGDSGDSGDSASETSQDSAASADDSAQETPTHPKDDGSARCGAAEGTASWAWCAALALAALLRVRR